MLIGVFFWGLDVPWLQQFLFEFALCEFTTMACRESVDRECFVDVNGPSSNPSSIDL